jgi:hypothetical protein
MSKGNGRPIKWDVLRNLPQEEPEQEPEPGKTPNFDEAAANATKNAITGIHPGPQASATGPKKIRHPPRQGVKSHAQESPLNNRNAEQNASHDTSSSADYDKKQEKQVYRWKQTGLDLRASWRNDGYGIVASVYHRGCTRNLGKERTIRSFTPMA